MTSRRLARASLYAAVYAALTLAPGLSSLAYGQVQFRVSESLLAFACFDAAAVPGLAVGTALGNIASPMGIVDVVAGSLLTLVAAALMWRLGPRLPALAMPVLVNGLGVGAELTLVLHLPFWASVGFVALGETVVMSTGGLLLLVLARRYPAGFGFGKVG